MIKTILHFLIRSQLKDPCFFFQDSAIQVKILNLIVSISLRPNAIKKNMNPYLTSYE